MKLFSSLTIAWVCSFALVACGGDSGHSGDDDDDDDDTVDGGQSGALVDESGNEISSVGSSDPVAIELSGLAPSAQYRLHVTGPGAAQLSPDDGFVVTTDEEGRVRASTVVQDLGSTSASLARPRLRSSRAAGAMPAEGAPGDYTILVQDTDAQDVVTIPFSVVDGGRAFCADADGNGQASFTPSDTVYLKLVAGAGDLADGTYTCYVVADLSAPLAENDPLPGIGGVAVTVSGGSGLAALGAYPPGTYDVVCDIDDDGFYVPGTDLISRAARFHPCFTSQEPNSGNDIVGQVCSDINGNYRDIFDPNATDYSIRDVWAWIAPREQSLVTHTIGVRKYVVAHQDVWSDGDALMDVTAGAGQAAIEVDAVQGFCTNESPWLVWPRERLDPGCFDCIIDVDADGLYTRGTDFVDNIDLFGDSTTCGTRVTDSLCGDVIAITSPADQAEVDATSIALSGSFGEPVISGTVIVTSARQSNTINLTPSGDMFEANIPLFNGANWLTVAALQEDGSMCGKTIEVTSTAVTSTNELFRVQLTWDGDTDMDLHVVRPNGAYSNGGLGSNSIDWGTAADEADDPKLDVDCVSCGNGIENIWMNEISEDGTYDVYVDAYSGTETAVNVSIFIRGAAVGTVACGAMTAGDALIDSCFVGTITWTGGSDGIGQFMVVNEKAGTF